MRTLFLTFTYAITVCGSFILAATLSCGVYTIFMHGVILIFAIYFIFILSAIISRLIEDFALLFKHVLLELSNCGLVKRPFRFS